MTIEVNKIYAENCLDTMARMPDGFVDLTVTSPPYDNLRVYTGESEWTFELFQEIARELYRVTKKGGVVVWVVGDATINGSETGTSFRQALYFKEIGFNLHDTMIWQKDAPQFPDAHRYLQVCEYQFVFSIDTPRAMNFIYDRRNISFGRTVSGTNRNADGTTRRAACFGQAIAEMGRRFNVWAMPNTKGNAERNHPAPFPEALARDHILSWSNEGDLVYDPFMGSGTTAKAAHQLKRRWIGSEISEEYVALANKRLEPYLAQESLF